jgi:cellulose biosynthesis protein BcsQ
VVGMNRIAVTAPKGGVGKTFVSCNLAWYMHLSRMQTKPCVVDFGANSDASRYLDSTAYYQAKREHGDDVVFETKGRMIVACCKDWDKQNPELGKNEAYKDIMTNPLAQSKVIEQNLTHWSRLQKCDRFIYDTDHFITTFIKFMIYFDRVILLYDADDLGSMENLACAWDYYSNYHLGDLVKKRPRKTFIVANKTENPEHSKTTFLNVCRRIFPHMYPSQTMVEDKLTELELFCEDNFGIPICPSEETNRSREESVPIWRIRPEVKEQFKQLATLVR